MKDNLLKAKGANMLDKANKTIEKILNAETPKQELAVEVFKQNVVDLIGRKIKGYIMAGELSLPQDYSVNNALKEAWLVLLRVKDRQGKPVLHFCTKPSIVNTLLNMVILGLNPINDQIYFIPYGDQLTCQISHLGLMAVAKRVNPLIYNFHYGIVYEEDEFEYEILNGEKMIQKHKQSLRNINKEKIQGAYCTVDSRGSTGIGIFFDLGIKTKTEIMTFEEIKQSWKQSIQRPIDEHGNVRPDTTHGKFTAEMCLKAVISKCCKVLMKPSSDNAFLLKTLEEVED